VTPVVALEVRLVVQQQDTGQVGPGQRFIEGDER
jgi:hypothetical protein